MLDKTAKDATYIVIAAVTLLLNVAEIVLILKIKRRKTFDKLLLSLAISDALVGAIAIVFTAFDGLGGKYLAWLQGDDAMIFVGFSVLFSISSLLLISADRFMAVKFPIKHLIILTDRRADLMIIVLWLFSLVGVALCCLVIFKWKAYFQLMLNAAAWCCIVYGVLISAIYVAIFCLICRRKMPAATSTSQRREEGNNVERRGFSLFLTAKYKAERTVFFSGCFVTLSFIVCTFPFAFEFIIRQSWANVSFASRLMMLLNSLLNPLVYFFKRRIGARNGRRGTETIELN